MFSVLCSSFVYKALWETLIYSQDLSSTELQDVYSTRTVLRGQTPALLCSGSLRMTQRVPHQPTHGHTTPPRATCWDSSQDTSERYLLLLLSSLSYVQLFASPWTAARQTSLPFTISQSLLKFMSIESVTPSNPPILYHPLLLLPSVFPRFRVFSSELALRIR